MCPLQLCSAGNYPCVNYSYGVPSIIRVSITVSLCVHNNEVVPAISGAGKTQCLGVSITVCPCVHYSEAVPAKSQMSGRPKAGYLTSGAGYRHW